ncbi:MAG: GNAT family N-acetyltransferase [Bacillota bacterium]|nr:GNAT family N-acetyltransferase [Bacillota bacterium]
MRPVQAADSRYRIETISADQSPVLLMLIRELAAFENELDSVTTTESDIRAAIELDLIEATVGYLDGQPAGFAITYSTYSSFSGRKGRFLDDLYIRPPYRKQGLGRLFMAYLTHRAVAEGCARFEWTCLDWNDPAHAFYQSLGAHARREKVFYRADGPLLEHLAAGWQDK